MGRVLEQVAWSVGRTAEDLSGTRGGRRRRVRPRPEAEVAVYTVWQVVPFTSGLHRPSEH